ncbi:MAG: hypothetical protein ABTD50_03710 [Polyangiaceae bacterium]|jgi:YD repeat-containing protein
MVASSDSPCHFDAGASRILESNAATTIQAASADGRQVFIFNPNGRHLQTIDALTNATLYQFAYDASGRLATVTGVHGDITTINHDPNGPPASSVPSIRPPR